jgi:hypothetical protein
MLNIFRPLFHMQEILTCHISQYGDRDEMYNAIECGRLMLEAGTDIALGTDAAIGSMYRTNFELILTNESAAS